MCGMHTNPLHVHVLYTARTYVPPYHPGFLPPHVRYGHLDVVEYLVEKADSKFNARLVLGWFVPHICICISVSRRKLMTRDVHVNFCCYHIAIETSPAPPPSTWQPDKAIATLCRTWSN